MNILRRSLILTAVFFVTAVCSSAQLTLHLDTTTQQLWFEGSASGDGYNDDSVPFYAQIWTDVNDSMVMDTEQLNVPFAVSASPNSLVAAAVIYQYTSGQEGIIVAFYWSDAGSLSNTITGTGSAFSVDYSGLSSAAITELESLSTLGISPDYPSTGFGDLGISVSASAVPEPSTYALMVGVAFLGFATWRRRRRPAVVNV